MLNRPNIFILILTVLAIAQAASADPEGCLKCHQYRGLARLSEDKKNIDLFYVDPNYYSMALGPHGWLKCTDCHVRSEVEVFPHQPQTPVDCRKVCHLSGPNQVEVRFSHEHVDQMLTKSVHGSKSLADSNQLLGNPLKPDQSQCLLCHDEPVYDGGQPAFQIRPRRSGAATPATRGSWRSTPGSSISTLPRAVHPARSNQDQVRLCAICHSNRAIQAKFNLPDTTVSYLASFHGKSTLLGSNGSRQLP